VKETVGSILGRKGREIWSVAPDATVYDAVALMAAKGIGAVLVTLEGRLLGLCRNGIMLGR
jgi:CBS domain-containing protein